MRVLALPFVSRRCFSLSFARFSTATSTAFVIQIATDANHLITMIFVIHFPMDWFQFRLKITILFFALHFFVIYLGFLLSKNKQRYIIWLNNILMVCFCFFCVTFSTFCSKWAFGSMRCWRQHLNIHRKVHCAKRLDCPTAIVLMMTTPIYSTAMAISSVAHQLVSVFLWHFHAIFDMLSTFYTILEVSFLVEQ